MSTVLTLKANLLIWITTCLNLDFILWLLFRALLVVSSLEMASVLLRIFAEVKDLVVIECIVFIVIIWHIISLSS